MPTTISFAESVHKLGLDSLHIIVDWEYDCAAANLVALPSRSAAFDAAAEADDGATCSRLQEADDDFWRALHEAFTRAVETASAKLGVGIKLLFCAYGSPEAAAWDALDGPYADDDAYDLWTELAADAYQEVYDQLATIVINPYGSWEIGVRESAE